MTNTFGRSPAMTWRRLRPRPTCSFTRRTSHAFLRASAAFQAQRGRVVEGVAGDPGGEGLEEERDEGGRPCPALSVPHGGALWGLELGLVGLQSG